MIYRKIHLYPKSKKTIILNLFYLYSVSAKKNEKHPHNFSIIFGKRHRRCRPTGKLLAERMPTSPMSVRKLKWKWKVANRNYTSQRQNGHCARTGLSVACNCLCRQQLQQKSLIAQFRKSETVVKMSSTRPWRTLIGDDATEWLPQ